MQGGILQNKEAIKTVNIGNEWDDILKDEFSKDYYLELRSFLINEYRTQTIYPGMFDIFNALKYTSFGDVRAVIIGQDPYHEPNQAHGLCFSVKHGNPAPPSLQNIFKELYADLGIDNSGKTELIPWAKSGVLLLNSVLTVRRGQANSHRGKGWEQFTDSVICALNAREKPVVFILWGANARAKSALITEKHHKILVCAHPSPLSAYNGFFGCRHFSATNAFLRENGLDEIDWRL